MWAKLGLVDERFRSGQKAEAKDHLEGARRHFDEHAKDEDFGPSEREYWRRRIEQWEKDL